VCPIAPEETGLAFIVASPRLLESRACTIEQMRLINTLCRFAEMAGSRSRRSIRTEPPENWPRATLEAVTTALAAVLVAAVRRTQRDEREREA
jgi:hypothetical protein